MGIYASSIRIFPSTAAFFGTYEYSKRVMINQWHVNETLAYFIAGILGDLASSIFYVPSEVLKTRLQLQGKYNNPYTKECGYNYRGLGNAIVTIAKTEGPKLLCLVIKRHCFVIYHSVPYNFHFTRLSVNGPFIQTMGRMICPYQWNC